MTLTTTQRFAHRHECQLHISPLCTYGNGKATRQHCKYCGGAVITHEGMWATYTWRGDGLYRDHEAHGLYLSRARAEAVAREHLFDNWVVRWMWRNGETGR